MSVLVQPVVTKSVYNEPGLQQLVPWQANCGATVVRGSLSQLVFGMHSGAVSAQSQRPGTSVSVHFPHHTYKAYLHQEAPLALIYRKAPTQLPVENIKILGRSATKGNQRYKPSTVLVRTSTVYYCVVGASPTPDERIDSVHRQTYQYHSAGSAVVFLYTGFFSVCVELKKKNDCGIQK